MLVLSGRVDDKFFVGNEGHYVQVVEIRARTVRLGFAFPGEIAVDREVVRKEKERAGVQR